MSTDTDLSRRPPAFGRDQIGDVAGTWRRSPPLLPRAATIRQVLAANRRDLPETAPGRACLVGIEIDAKRVCDVVLALSALLVLSPLLLAIAGFLRITSCEPVLFRQLRWGRNNVPFEVLKFRTMRGRPSSVLALGCPTENMRRATAFGQLLRRTNLDELPQLLNVLRGDMSLVGPRPHATAMHVCGKLYEDLVPNYRDRHAVRPGITGLAQISGCAGEVTTVEHARRRVALDLHYIRTRSLALDLVILLHTVRHHLLRPGGTRCAEHEPRPREEITSRRIPAARPALEQAQQTARRADKSAPVSLG